MRINNNKKSKFPEKTYLILLSKLQGNPIHVVSWRLENKFVHIYFLNARWNVVKLKNVNLGQIVEFDDATKSFFFNRPEK